MQMEGHREQEQNQQKQDMSEGSNDLWPNKQDKHGAVGKQDATARKFFSDCFSLLLLCFSLNHFPNHLQPPNYVYRAQTLNTLGLLFLKKTPNPFFVLEYGFLKYMHRK